MGNPSVVVRAFYLYSNTGILTLTILNTNLDPTKMFMLRSVTLKWQQELIRRWDSERELLRSRPGKLPEFAEVTQNNGHYAVQGHSRSPILVPIESSYMISY